MTVDKSASALQKSGRIFLQRYQRATSGLSIAWGPVNTAAADDPAAATRALLDTLAPPSETVPHPTQEEWRSVQAPMLEAVGAKTWAAMARGAKAVGIELAGDVVTFLPSADYEHEGGRNLSGKCVVRRLDDPTLGAGLIEAFAACE